MRVDSPMISYHSLEGGKSDRIMSVDCHPDASDGLVTFATVGGGGEGDVRLWSLAPDAEAPVYRSSLRKGHDGSVNCARWSPDGAKLCSAGDRGTVCVWSGQSTAAWWRGLDDRDERVACGRLSHNADVYDVCWSPCGIYVLSGSIDGVATVWHADARRPVKVVRDHEHYVQGVAWDPLGTCFATASSDRTVKVYALPDKWAASKKPLAPKTVRFWGDERARRREEAHGAAAPPKGNIYDKLCDTSLYTGAHKQRFDETGQGRGLAGRDFTAKGGIAGRSTTHHGFQGDTDTKTDTVFHDASQFLMR